MGLSVTAAAGCLRASVRGRGSPLGGTQEGCPGWSFVGNCPAAHPKPKGNNRGRAARLRKESLGVAAETGWHNGHCQGVSDAARLLPPSVLMQRSASPVPPGHPHPHTGTPPSREGSYLPPALSSSSVLSLLPDTQVSTELLFKMNRVLPLCQALCIISGSPSNTSLGKGPRHSVSQIGK